MNRRPFFSRALIATAALSGALLVAGCKTDNPAYNARANKPLSEAMVADLNSKNMEKDSPLLIRLFKQEAELEVWKQDRSGRYQMLKTYPICRWSGELGPKVREGDRQAPEGFYTITPGQMNPNSSYYLAFNLGYPNAYDQSHGRTGSQLMIHGDCSSRGCYAMSDEQITEIFGLGREAFFGGQRSFQVQAYPFRMTPANFAKHRNNPNIAFWKMLKEGNDHFEVTRLEPKIDVCEKRYVFNGASPNMTPVNFNSKGKCPVYQVPAEIAQAVQQKQRQDDIQTAELVSRRVATAPVKTGADGGMHPVFAGVLGGRDPEAVAGNLASLASLSGAPTIRLPRDNGSQPAAPIKMPEPGAQPIEVTPAAPSEAPAIANTPPANPSPVFVQPAPAPIAAPIQTASVPLPRAAPQPKTGAAPTQVAEQPSSFSIGSFFRTASAQPDAVAVPSAPQPMPVPQAAPSPQPVPIPQAAAPQRPAPVVAPIAPPAPVQTASRPANPGSLYRAPETVAAREPAPRDTRVSLRGSEPPAATAWPTPAAPAPSAIPSRSNPGAIRPQQAEPAPQPAPAPVRNAQPAPAPVRTTQPAPAPAQTTASAPSSAMSFAPSSGFISGAAPTLGTGAFR